MATTKFTEDRKHFKVTGTKDELTKALTVRGAKAEGDGVIIPFKYLQSVQMTRLGLPTVSPVHVEYKYPRPSFWEVMRHQKKIVDFLVRNPRGYCFAGTGTGKTASALWAADYLISKGVVSKVLVVCPVSVMLDAWVASIGNLFMFKHSATVLDGTRNRRVKRIGEATTFHIINPDGLSSISNELLEKHYDCVIVDESTMIKNTSSNRYKALKPLIKQATYAWQLTGTPTPQGPMDALGQIELFDRHEAIEGFKTSKEYWRNKTMVKVTTFKWVNKSDWQSTVAKYLNPAIRINTRDCIDLPARRNTRLFAPMTTGQSEAIKDLVKYRNILIDGQQVTAVQKGALLSKMAQICCGAVLDKKGQAVRIDPTPRIDLCDDIIRESEGKVLIYVPFRAAVTTIAEALRARGWKVAELTGDATKEQRQTIFNRVQTPGREGLDVLVAIPRCLSHGVTLTEANNIIWYAPVTSNEEYEQANARIERKGQVRSITVTEIWSHPREKEMYDVIAGRTKGQLTLLNIYNRLLSET